MKKRLLAVLLCVIMVLLPTAAFAADTPITPSSATFDKYTASTGLYFTLETDSTFQLLTNGDKALRKGPDYTVNGKVYFIVQDYLNTLNVGTVTLTFDMDKGIDPTVNIVVTDTNPAITFDVAGDINKGDTVWFGKYDSYDTYDIPWTMLRDYEALLFSKYALGNSQFDSNNGWFYKDSTLNVKMDELYNAGENSLFTSNERNLIIEEEDLDCDPGPNDNHSSPEVPKAYLFPLTQDEVYWFRSTRIETTYDRSDPNGDAKSWWLRSSDPEKNDPNRAYAMANGSYGGRDVTDTRGIRPAFFLNLNSVLFASAAVGGKADTVDSTLTPVGKNPTMDWKLTLPDASRSEFVINTTSLDTSSATVNYMNAKTGPNEFISAMIVENGKGTYYGRILKLDGKVNGASGTVTINIPSGVTLDADTKLKVFNEQFNGDRTSANITNASRAYTDYASELKTVNDAQIPDPIVYQITQDANGSWPKGSSDGMRITSNGDYDKFLGVSVDGGTISKNKYTSKSGSTTIVTLKASYLETLSIGEHAIKLNFFDGYAEAHFTIEAATNPDIPATGDNSQLLLFLIIALLSGAGIIASLTHRRKNRQNE